ncbi:hypothetical protein SpCBS45565_g07324 [Spizellomyces sp. 'palustris']|nr:hypothetical protein SpCBS45565_g07324 [Spizellomyces sp. 'palustris']
MSKLALERSPLASTDTRHRQKGVATTQTSSNVKALNDRSPESTLPSPPYNTAPAAHVTGRSNSVQPRYPLPRLKSALRSILLPIIQYETSVIANLQRRIRSPLVYACFKYLGALGTHTAFLLLLPMLFWFESGAMMDVHGRSIDVNRVYGRSLVLLLAAGVYLSGAVKDYLGLPRPFSPPVSRVSVSRSVDAEYGFPSTHTANAVSLSLFTGLFFLKHWSDGWADNGQRNVLAVLTLYSILIAVSRIVTGMHTLLDVLGGAVIGGGLVVIHWLWIMPTMEEWLMTSWTVPIIIVPICILLISIHPDPDGPCPCFDDSVAFVGVVMGLMIGNWHHVIYVASSGYTAIGKSATLGPVMVIQRLVYGVSIIVAWRLSVKRICYALLPPLYRLLAFPFRRKYFALADKDYQSIPSSHVGSFAPSLLHLPTSERNRFKLPRYDVDIATKLIVYSGIGWLATEGIPVLFELLGL